MDSKELRKIGFNTRTLHGYTLNPAKEKLAEAGIYLQDNTDNSRLHGLYYFGNSFPAEIQYYVTNVKLTYPQGYVTTNQKPSLDNSYLVYSHYERRWGKDLSWVKLAEIKEK